MKNVCQNCNNAKWKSTGCYCLKYGIVLYQQRAYCVAFETRLKDVSESKPDIQVRQR